MGGVVPSGFYKLFFVLFFRSVVYVYVYIVFDENAFWASVVAALLIDAFATICRVYSRCLPVMNICTIMQFDAIALQQITALRAFLLRLADTMPKWWRDSCRGCFLRS